MADQETIWRQNLDASRPALSAIATALVAGAIVVAGLSGPRVGQGDTSGPAQASRSAATEAGTRAASPARFNVAEYLERRLLAEARAFEPAQAASPTRFNVAEYLERRLLAEARAFEPAQAASPARFNVAEYLERRLLAEARAFEPAQAASPTRFNVAEYLERRLLAEARALGD